MLSISLLDLILIQLSISVEIHGSEDIGDLLLFLLGKKLTGDESICGLLQLGFGIEILEVGKGTNSLLTVDLVLTLLNPWMLQSLFGGWSLVLVHS